ncbi:MAG: AMP-binding protein [Gammaproteobacteria bacterium]|nr:AMP-binding protein [Gammaproteobacteria bacterium]
MNDLQWQLPGSFNFGRDVIDAIAGSHPDRLALIWCDQSGRERRYSFGEISRRTNQLAALLAAEGVGRGDRVLVMLPRLPQWQIAMVGCLKLGAVPIPCIDMLTAKDVLYRATCAQAVGAITTRANVEKFSGTSGLKIRVAVGGAPRWLDFDAALDAQPATFACADTGIEDPAVIYFTSGSTGLPKGVTHAARGLYCWRGSARDWLDLHSDDLMWCTADTGWSKAGTSILFGPWSQGAGVLFYDGRFDAAERLRLIAHYGVTVFCGAATEFRHLVNEDFSGTDLSRLRLAVSAGESVNPEVVRRWQELTGIPLLEAYGQTETLMTVANGLGRPMREGSMGRALPGCRMAVLSPEGRPLPPGESGQLALVLPNPQLMLGYWQEPERTAAAFSSHDGVEYFLTGDLAHMDDNGFIYYAGRVDDIISSAGYRIGPIEVENALQEHPAVTECAVIGSPDAERGEIVKAFVVLRKGVEASDVLKRELQEHVKRVTAPYKYPRLVEFLPELPKSAAGKLLRRVLRDAERKPVTPLKE